MRNYDIDLRSFQPRDAYRKHVAALRACGVPRTLAKRTARDLLEQVRLAEGAVGKRKFEFACTEVEGGWIVEMFVPRDGLSAEQCAIVEGLGGSSAARMLGRLQ